MGIEWGIRNEVKRYGESGRLKAGSSKLDANK
jgi:hypothetical protein